MNQTLTLNEIREKGLKALTKELTPTEVARFFQMFEKGEGDYTLEKKKIYILILFNLYARLFRKVNQYVPFRHN